MIELTSEDTNRHWSLIRETIADSLPPLELTDQVFANCQKELLTGLMTAWFINRTGSDGKPELTAILVTTLMNDMTSGNRQLLIYAIKSFSEHGLDLYRSELEQLENYAKKNQCRAIVAFVKDERLTELTQRLGFRKSMYVWKEV